VVEPLINPGDRRMIAAGPIGKVEAPQFDAGHGRVAAAGAHDLTEDQQDGSEQAKANTSEDALAFAATRVDAKSGIYLDNMRQSVECEGEIYLSMSPTSISSPAARSRR
jgi:hypothetical protein